MINLTTEVYYLTYSQIKRIMREVVDWAAINISCDDEKYKTLKLSVRSQQVWKYKNQVKKYAWGRYTGDENKIVLYVDNISSKKVKDIIEVTLHEYCHFLQDLTDYDKILKEIGYKNHPQEIEAREMEKYYSRCWYDIKQKLIW
jgi:hypothetical protein